MAWRSAWELHWNIAANVEEAVPLSSDWLLGSSFAFQRRIINTTVNLYEWWFLFFLFFFKKWLIENYGSRDQEIHTFDNLLQHRRYIFLYKLKTMGIRSRETLQFVSLIYSFLTLKVRKFLKGYFPSTKFGHYIAWSRINWQRIGVVCDQYYKFTSPDNIN